MLSINIPLDKNNNFVFRLCLEILYMNRDITNENNMLCKNYVRGINHYEKKK